MQPIQQSPTTRHTNGTSGNSTSGNSTSGTNSQGNGQGATHFNSNSASNGAATQTALEGLRAQLQSRDATIGILGLGYVGLPLGMAFAQAGFSCLGFDTKPATVQALQAGHSHIEDVPSAQVQALRERQRFSATTDFSLLSACDCILICVPTPLNAMREPDLTFVQAACHSVAQSLRRGQLVILESTTYPGTTEEVLLPMLEAGGLKAGSDFFLGFSPERIDPGNKKFPLGKVPKVVGGYSSSCLQAALDLYNSIIETTVPVSSTRAAEMTKLLENIFRSVNIALVNELAMLCDRMGIDVWEVVEAAGTKPYGFTKFLPGPGLGGHCIPVDPFYLSWKAREYDFVTSFIELAGQVNRAMPRYVVEKISRALNDEAKAVRGAKIGILGVSYKPDVGDCRESPSLEVMRLLLELGAQVSYHDPHVESVKIDGQEFRSQELESVLAGDCVVLLTNHRAYDYAAIAQQAELVVDTRNAFANVESSQARIVKL